MYIINPIVSSKKNLPCYLQSDLIVKLKKHASSVVEVEITKFTRTEDGAIFHVKDKAKFHKNKYPTFTVRNRNNNINVPMAPCQHINIENETRERMGHWVYIPW